MNPTRQWRRQLAIDLAGWFFVGLGAGAVILAFYALLFATFAPRG